MERPSPLQMAFTLALNIARFGAMAVMAWVVVLVALVLIFT